MAVFVNDTFTDADTTAIDSHTGELGATWARAPGDTNGAGNDPKIEGNKLRGGGGGNGICYASGSPGSADYTVTGVFVYSSGTWVTIYGPAGRMSTSANTGYFAILFSNEIRLYKFVAGSLTQIGSGVALTPAAGTFSVTLDMAGTTIAVRVQRASDSNWLATGDTWQAGQINCISETDSAIAAAGKAGFWGAGDITVGVMTSFTADDGAVPASFTATPTTIPANHAGNITITLTGTDTTWAGGGSEFSISGVANVTKISENVTSATAATLVVTTGAGTGTLQIEDGDAAIDTVEVAAATLAVTPTTADVNTTPTVTLTGTNTLWDSETPAGLFTVSGGTGASIGTPTVTSDTEATAVLTAGSQNEATLTITDESTNATDTVATTDPSSADVNGLRSAHFDAGTAALTAQLTRAGAHLRITNRHDTAICYFTVSSNLAGPSAITTAVAAADDTYPCGPASSIRVPTAGGSQVVVSIVADDDDVPVSIETFDLIPDHHGRYD